MDKEGDKKEGYPVKPEVEGSSGSKFKLKRGSIQRSNRFQKTIKRKSRPDGEQDSSDEGENVQGSQGQEPQGQGLGQATNTDKEAKEIENMEKRMNEVSIDEDNDDYDDYSTHLEREVCKDPSHSATSETDPGLVDNLVDIGASVSGFLGRFTTHAWSYAKTTLQSYQDYLLASDSEDDEWGESRADQDSDDDDSEFNFQDAAEELKVTAFVVVYFLSTSALSSRRLLINIAPGIMV